MEKFLNRIWYSNLSYLSYILLPVTFLYYIIISIRKLLYHLQLFSTYKSQIPVFVIGNITIGGSGKTPLCIWVCKYLQGLNKIVGIVSSGYKGTSTSPVLVDQYSDPYFCGDEALLIFQQTHAHVVSGADRVEATKLLENKFNCDLIIHDDGLQHYQLLRDYEVLVIDHNRGLGNEFILPAGPLRESKSKLNDVDLVVYNNYKSDDNIASINTITQSVTNITTRENRLFSTFKGKTIHLVTAIASTDTIIKALDMNNISYNNHAYPDHYSYTGNEIFFDDSDPVFITSKDYVKLKEATRDNIWVIDHKIEPNSLFINEINKFFQKKNII